MNFRWRLLLATLGFFIQGPIGLIIGFFIGYVLDKQSLLKPRATNEAVQRVFFDVSFQVMGYLAKSDGRVSENEISAARKVMDQMGLNDSMKQEAIRLFNDGKQSHFNVEVALGRLKRACWRHPSLLRMFLEIQWQMAYADGRSMSPDKRRAFEHVFQLLGISVSRFDQFYSNFSGGRYTGGQGRASASSSGVGSLREAYRLLEIKSSASDADVKKAYRRHMSKNHPDRLIAKGLPPEMIKMATHKTQQVKAAYEKIKAARGIG